MGTMQLYAQPENGTEIKITPKTSYDEDVAAGKGYTAEEKDKLRDIEERANNYTHPETHPADMIETDADHQFVTEKARTIYGENSLSHGLKEGIHSGLGSLSFGAANDVSPNFTYAIGYGNTVGDMYSAASGNGNTVSGGHSVAAGLQNSVNGDFAVAAGQNNTAAGRTSLTIGAGNKAEEEAAVAIGQENESTGFASFCMGYGNMAGNNRFPVAVGYHNKSTGFASFAEGGETEASGGQSHAEGSKTRASGATGSHAEGNETVASGVAAHAEGYLTKAFGNAGAHAEGNGSIASGNISHAEGNGAVAAGIASHAEGNNTLAASKYQHVQGQYNEEDAAGKYVHIIGGGRAATGEETEPVRKNIHTVDWEGNARYAGDVTNGNGISLDSLEQRLQTEIERIAIQTVENIEYEPVSGVNYWSATITYPQGFTAANCIILKEQYGFMNVAGVWKSGVTNNDRLMVQQEENGVSVTFQSSDGISTDMRFRIVFLKI